MGIVEVLTLILVTLKAFELIAWSWWLVFTPLMVVYALVVLLVVLAVTLK